MRQLAVGIMGIVLALNITALAKDKVLYVDSYHAGFGWSDGITEGVVTGLGDAVDLKIIRMDTKRNPDEAYKQNAALMVKKEIEDFQPDVVITSDDNAAKYVVASFYKDTELPFVFCGVNWDASAYGFPCKNITGMIEVTPVDGLIEELKKIAQGSRVGYLGPDRLTAHKDYEHSKELFNIDFTPYFATDYDDYKKGFKQLQESCDMVIIYSDGGLFNNPENVTDLEAFFAENTKVPTGSNYDFMSNLALVSFSNVAQEQGFWAADKALKILQGTSPAAIPIERNTQGKLIINAKIIEASGLEVPYEMVGIADQIIE